jgi:hypothetical protein
MFCREANMMALAKLILLRADQTLHSSLMQRVVILKMGGKGENQKRKQGVEGKQKRTYIPD